MVFLIAEIYIYLGYFLVLSSKYVPWRHIWKIFFSDIGVLNYTFYKAVCPILWPNEKYLFFGILFCHFFFLFYLVKVYCRHTKKTDCKLGALKPNTWNEAQRCIVIMQLIEYGDSNYLFFTVIGYHIRIVLKWKGID